MSTRENEVAPRRRVREQQELVKMMRATGLTSEELARKLEYHEVVIRQWMNGDKTMGKHARRLVRRLLEEHNATQSA